MKSQKETKSQRLTNEQLAERLAGKSCCGKEMILAENHQENSNKVCLKYVCSQCKVVFLLMEKSLRNQ
jgi:hypothetical protein